MENVGKIYDRMVILWYLVIYFPSFAARKIWQPCNEHSFGRDAGFEKASTRRSGSRLY
jgi:hypothetical protein